MSTFQQSLFGEQNLEFDASMKSVERVWLDSTAWIDLIPGWVRGADRLFDDVLRSQTWGQRQRLIHGKMMIEPRLTSHWKLGTGPLEPNILEDIRRSLMSHYGIEFDSLGFNHYRDGDDSVAWHRDTIAKTLENPIVALVSLGEPRKFLIRPLGGGASKSFNLGRGDLLVTGGESQRTWEHSVPKVKHAGQRISLAYRHGLESRAYEREIS